ncbi:MAG: LLM class flavin-dependent oxidoreductase [Deltaproteobacteria bacterium]|nr:LLM class flavin-dependent oxidoreductase [Deltaproteobacteria bacterium]
MRPGLMTLGDHLPNPNDGERISQQEHHRQIVDNAVLAEELGFDSIWLGEHHFCDYILSSPPVVLAAIAERTERLRLGTAVTLLPTLDPVRVAEDYATVDLLSGGRLEVTVGRGILANTYTSLSRDYADSVEMGRENLELLIELWTKEEVHFDAKFRAPLSGVRVEPHPVQHPHPPIWLAGASENSLRVGATLGLDLMLPSVMVGPEGFVPVVDRYRELYSAAGHDAAKLEIGACSHVHVAADSQTARKRWEPYLSGYFAWVAELVKWSGSYFPDNFSLDFEAILEGPAICGSPAEVTDRILRMRELLGLNVHLAMLDHGGIPHNELVETLTLYGRQVIPNIK